ncbi:MAG: hypothetical protein V3S55_00035, partial [Nitrospiraceae bacterium]
QSSHCIALGGPSLWITCALDIVCSMRGRIHRAEFLALRLRRFGAQQMKRTHARTAIRPL